jgi:hypothetical protein
VIRSGSERRPERLRGVTELPEACGERRYRAWIKRGKGRQVNLGLYSSRWLAAFAFNVAAEALHGGHRPRNAIPESEQPGADQVRRITARVRRRLGLDEPSPRPEDRVPSADQLLTLFEITVVGFWRDQVARHDADLARELDLAARRLVEAAHVLFWSHSAGHPTPREALEELLARRLDRTFRRVDLTREVLDDDGDDEVRMARWLVYPDDLPGGDGFRRAIEHLYSDLPGADSTRSTATEIPAWAAILRICPPYSSEQVRSAYRARSKAVHPDIGGDHTEFIHLQSAYKEARWYCASRGL